MSDFNFQRHYGAEVKEIKTRSGQRFVTNLNEVVLREGDTLVVMADDTFIPTWGESSVFVLLTNGNDPDTAGKKKRWLALILLVLMIVGATIGELPVTKRCFRISNWICSFCVYHHHCYGVDEPVSCP